MRVNHQRVDPAPSDHPATGHALQERAVERSVVRHDVAVADELDEPRHRRFCARRPSDVLSPDPGQARDLDRNRRHGVDEGGEAVEYLGAAHDGCGDLDESISLRIVAGRLHVEDDDLALEPEHLLGGAVRQRRGRRRRRRGRSPER